MGINKVKWKCNDCGYVGIADPFEHHKMDNCPCGNGVDVETYCTRWIGNVSFVKKIVRDFEKERLEPIWTTYGLNNEFPKGKLISVSEMSDEYLLNVYSLDHLSERIKWLTQREMKKRGIDWRKLK